MKKVFFALAVILFAKFNAQGWKTDEQYIQKFALYAVEEMEKKKVEKLVSTAESLNAILIKSHPNGGKKFVIIPNDIALAAISKKFQITESALMKWNELDGNELRRNDILFLENKSNKGNVATYKAQAAESMHDISQKFGVKLNKLYSKNRMDYGQQPKAGQLIYLQSKKPRK